jgi:hypothetical protein
VLRTAVVAWLASFGLAAVLLAVVVSAQWVLARLRSVASRSSTTARTSGRTAVRTPVGPASAPVLRIPTQRHEERVTA